MISLSIHHKTTYRYRSPVAFGPHRLMLRPRERRELRLTGFEFTVTPQASVNWAHDIWGNAVATTGFHTTGRYDNDRQGPRFARDRRPEPWKPPAWGLRLKWRRRRIVDGLPRSAAGAADSFSPAGPDTMQDSPEEWDELDKTSDESFPASDPPAHG